MALLQLIGQGAFIVASIALGVKLLLLWRRTHELPELSLGLAFLLGGGFGYLAWFALAIVGRESSAFHPIALLGLALTGVGAVAFGIGVARIFRAGSLWPKLAVAAIGLGMLVAWFDVQRVGMQNASTSFWLCLDLSMPIYAWGAIEAFVVGRTLHRRARLGMADPIVVNRLFQWALAGSATIAMFALSFFSMLVHGPITPAWVMALNAGLGLVSATTIWLGFFPPRSLRERLVRAYASESHG